MIKIEALRVFANVAENGSLKEAAEQLGRTQSALSMTLKQLEEELGGTLFETDRKRNLTNLGEYVLNIALEMLHQHDQGLDLIERYAKGKSGRLRMASVPSVAALLLPKLLRGFLLDSEGADIDLVDTDSVSVRDAVASGRADIGIASAGQGMEGLKSEVLFSDQLYVICRRDNKLASQTSMIEYSMIATEALIMNETLIQLDHPEFLEIASRSHLKVRNTLSLLAMVSAGAGITILPGLAKVSLDENLIALPLADENCARQVCLLTSAQRTPSPLVEQMSVHLRTHLPDMANAKVNAGILDP